MAENRKSGVLVSCHFYNLHNRKKVEYETRDPEVMLPVDKLLSGLRVQDIMFILYDRPAPEGALPLKHGDANPGEVSICIKHLNRLESETCTDPPSPVFFFGFAKYDENVNKYREDIRKEYSKYDCLDERKVSSIYDVAVGGLFACKSLTNDYLCRVRIIKIDLSKGTVRYWAVDEAFYDECQHSNLMYLNNHCAYMPMLAVPGMFAEDPSPAQLHKFQRTPRGYVIAKIRQPTYAQDFAPREVRLI